MLVKTNFASVQPIGSAAVEFPPQGTMVRKMTHFVPVWIDDAVRMDAPPFVVDRFPDENSMTAVMAVPGGAVGYHVGRYGSWWPTDPAERASCYAAGRLTLEGVPNGA